MLRKTGLKFKCPSMVIYIEKNILLEIGDRDNGGTIT